MMWNQMRDMGKSSRKICGTRASPYVSHDGLTGVSGLWSRAPPLPMRLASSREWASEPVPHCLDVGVVVTGNHKGERPFSPSSFSCIFPFFQLLLPLQNPYAKLAIIIPFPSCSLLSFHFFFSCLFTYFEKEAEHEQGRGRQRGRENPHQALRCQYRA